MPLNDLQNGNREDRLPTVSAAARVVSRVRERIHEKICEGGRRPCLPAIGDEPVSDYAGRKYLGRSWFAVARGASSDGSLDGGPYAGSRIGDVP